MIRPTAEQQAILDLGPTSIRVRAGAGTGKTTTVALAIANLVDKHGIAPESILGLTFTNKAAAELASRVRDLLPGSLDGARQVEVHTYHGFAAQLVSEFGPIAGVDSSKGIVTPTFGRQLIRDVVMNRDFEILDITNFRAVDKVRRLADQLGDHRLSPIDITRAGEIHAGDRIWDGRVEIASALVEYEATKARLRVVDYSDLVTKSVNVLQSHKHLADLVRSRYSVLVLDEYQDTNPAQRLLLTTIFDEGFPVIGVGDEDQTIYEWRGASTENFQLFTDHFRQPDGAPAVDLSLTLNRRSGGRILDVANEVRRKANPNADHLSPAEPSDSEVVAHWADDAIAEAEWIAGRFEMLRQEGARWSDMAILFRKNKDFSVVIDVLTQHDIPIEVANVGGLLSVPEISLLRAWLSILHDPNDSASVAHILLGSSYRMGLADLAALTRMVNRTARDEDSERAPQLSLIEIMEDPSALETVRPEARQRFERFLETYRPILLETQGRSLAETVREILDRTKAWQDIDAMSPSSRLSARLNVYRFLDLVDDWSPLSGRPSLGAFLEYLEAMEEEPADELDSARLSGEDAVTLVTVHRAKGLEWDVVAIPAVVKGNFPSGSSQFPDPVRFSEYLPVELRLDSVLDDFPDDGTSQKAYLRERHMAQEWRVAYVALTRAKSHLFVTGSHWYGQPEPNKTPSQPSDLYTLVAAHPSSDSGDLPPVGVRPELLRLDESADAPDPLFPSGWQAALRMAIDDPERVDELAAQLGLEAAHSEQVDEWRQTLFDLSQVEDKDSAAPTPTVSVTGLVTYAQCPKRYYWSEVEPLPRRINTAAVRGNEVHRRIELHQRGQVPFDDLEPSLYDVVEGSETGGTSPYATYTASRFSEQKAALIEAPFSVSLDNGFSVRGRIDAVYEDGGRWEIVDFKSGRRSTDPSRMVQLEAYAVAAKHVDFGLRPPTEVDVTFAYLGDGLDEVSERADARWVSEAETHLGEITDSIAAGDFSESPGPWCHQCDFLRFCAPGKEQVGE